MGTATMPAATALGIPYPLQVSYQFDGAEELLHSLHALFGLLATANTPRHCPQASGFGKQLCTAAGTDSAHILSIALSLASALQTGRSTLAIAGVFRAGKTRSLTFLLAWFAITTNLRFGVAHKENPAGRAITKLLSSLELDEDQQALFIRPVGGKKQLPTRQALLTTRSCTSALVGCQQLHLGFAEGRLVRVERMVCTRKQEYPLAVVALVAADR